MQGLVERHQDYVFPIDQSLTLPAAMAAPEVFNFQLDPDAPFELRSLAARVPYDANGTQYGLQHVLMSYSDEQNNFTSDFPIPLFCQMAYFGQAGNPIPRYPGLRYSASGVMRIQIQNVGPNPLTGLQLFFRGVKVFKPGEITSYTYPQKVRRPPLSYVYSLARPNSSIQGLAVTDSRLNQIWQSDPDCDFVVRGGQAGIPSRALLVNILTAYEVFFTFRDESGKPYSNAPVHADVMFGRGSVAFQPGSLPVYPCGPAPTQIAPIGPGPSLPGLFYPEIYVPRNHHLIYDVYRNDSAYVGAQTTDYYPVTLIGMKVWPA